jgi:N-acylneuraminate cytidylyltransferase/CMP-N,N'-diacetyllegionaminic acid synthase
MKRKLYILIPARSGSIRIKNKNLKPVGGVTLLERKIKTAIKSKIGKVFVSTNCKKIAKISKSLGAEVPFLRPKVYSNSKSSTISCVLHFIRFLNQKKIHLPEYLAVLPVTNPFLKVSSVKSAFYKIQREKKYNSIISYRESSEHPFLFVKKNKKLFFDIIKYEGYKYSDFERTQDWPKAYIASPALKISKIQYFNKFIKNKNPYFNEKTFDYKNCLGLKIKNIESVDINDQFDLNFANKIIDLAR